MEKQLIKLQNRLLELTYGWWPNLQSWSFDGFLYIEEFEEYRLSFFRYVGTDFQTDYYYISKNKIGELTEG